MPDLQGRVPVGKGTNASVNALGANDGQSAANRRPHHRTTNSLGLSDPGHAHGLGNASGVPTPGTNVAGPANSQFTNTATTGIALTGSVGTNNANDALDTPSFLVINYIIKT